VRLATPDGRVQTNGMRRGLIVRLIIALLAGACSALATYQLTSRSPPAARKAGQDDADPGLIP
jgi:hypothetical protein